MTTTQSSWWKDFFDSDFSAFLLDREHDPSLAPTADFIIAALILKQGDRIFDQCCGTGAVSRALAERGLHVIGVDQAPHYIDRAKALSAEQQLTDIVFEEADAFEYTTQEKCDAAINWYSSFGYTEDDSTNILMMERAKDSLRSGGLFALDYMNVPNLIANFEPIYTRVHYIAGEEVMVHKHTTIDEDQGMVRSRWIYDFSNGPSKEAQGESRLYMPEDIISLMKKTGFVDVESYGGFNKEPCNKNQQRCIVIGRAP